MLCLMPSRSCSPSEFCGVFVMCDFDVAAAIAFDSRPEVIDTAAQPLTGMTEHWSDLQATGRHAAAADSYRAPRIDEGHEPHEVFAACMAAEDTNPIVQGAARVSRWETIHPDARPYAKEKAQKMSTPAQTAKVHGLPVAVDQREASNGNTFCMVTIYDADTETAETVIVWNQQVAAQLAGAAKPVTVLTETNDEGYPARALAIL